MLLNLSRCLLVHLQSRMEGWDEGHTLIGDIFLDLVSYHLSLSRALGRCMTYFGVPVNSATGTSHEGVHQLRHPPHLWSTGNEPQGQSYWMRSKFFYFTRLLQLMLKLNKQERFRVWLETVKVCIYLPIEPACIICVWNSAGGMWMEPQFSPD